MVIANLQQDLPFFTINYNRICKKGMRRKKMKGDLRLMKMSCKEICNMNCKMAGLMGAAAGGAAAATAKKMKEEKAEERIEEPFRISLYNYIICN